MNGELKGPLAPADGRVKSLGADECIDYKDKEYPKHLAAALPDYADRYFDNVGGDILNEMLSLIKRHGKIIACGAISGESECWVRQKCADFKVTMTRASKSPSGER